MSRTRAHDVVDWLRQEAIQARIYADISNKQGFCDLFQRSLADFEAEHLARVHERYAKQLDGMANYLEDSIGKP